MCKLFIKRLFSKMMSPFMIILLLVMRIILRQMRRRKRIPSGNGSSLMFMRIMMIKTMLSMSNRKQGMITFSKSNTS
jgi:hypothetical protein